MEIDGRHGREVEVRCRWSGSLGHHLATAAGRRPTGARSARRGFVLGVVFIVLVVLAILVFSFNQFSRRQFLRQHHDELVETADLMALNGLQFLFERLKTDPRTRDSLAREAAPLFGPDPVPVGAPLTVAAPATARLVRDDLNRLLRTVPLEPTCSELTLQFGPVASLHEQVRGERTPQQLTRYGFLPEEKSGFIEAACVIDYGRGLRRRLSLRRQFRLVGMIPGPWSRFTLFAPRTPGVDAFNQVRSTITGRYLSGSPRRLVLINGSDTFEAGNPDRFRPPNLTPDPGSEPRLSETYLDLLKHQGWVYLGPAPPPPGASPLEAVAVTLGLPAGYDPPGARADFGNDPFSGYASYLRSQDSLGANIYLSPYQLTSSRALGPAMLRLAAPGQIAWLRPEWGLSLRLFGLFAGVVGTPQPPATGFGMWYRAAPNGDALPIGINECRSSFLLPFGTRQFLSPTLVVGPVTATYLSYAVLERAPGFGAPQQVVLQLHPDRMLMVTGHTGASFAWADPPLTGVGPGHPLASWSAFIDDRHREFAPERLHLILPKYAGFPLGSPIGVPANLLVEAMMRPFVGQWQVGLDQWRVHSPMGVGLGFISGRPQLPLPRGGSWEQGGYPLPGEALSSRMPPRYIMPHDDLTISRVPVDRNPPTSACPIYYRGNLDQCLFRRTGAVPCDELRYGLLRRVTHEVNLGPANTGPRERLAALLNQRVLVPGTIDGREVYLFDQPGIYLLRGLGANETLTIDRPIWLRTSGMIVLESGHLGICGVDSADLTVAGWSRHLCTLVALDGDLRLSPSPAAGGGTAGAPVARPIHAFLVALAERTTGSGGVRGGAILARAPGAAGPLWVSGGIAAVEVAPRAGSGDCLQRHFPEGGIVRYHPGFNPGLALEEQDAGWRAARFALSIGWRDEGVIAGGAR